MESLSSLTEITHNLQVKINFKKGKKRNTKNKGADIVDLLLETAILHQFTMFLLKLNSPWTETESHMAITTQPEENKEKW